MFNCNVVRKIETFDSLFLYAQKLMHTKFQKRMRWELHPVVTQKLKIVVTMNANRKMKKVNGKPTSNKWQNMSLQVQANGV